MLDTDLDFLLPTGHVHGVQDFAKELEGETHSINIGFPPRGTMSPELCAANLNRLQ